MLAVLLVAVGTWNYLRPIPAAAATSLGPAQYTITGTPPNREINKTALGATESVAWEHCETLEPTIARLKEQGYTVLAIEQTDSSVPLQEYSIEPSGKYVLIFGNEVFGVSEEAIALSDTALEIPQFGTKHSFNVSVTGGIVLWEFFRKMHFLDYGNVK